jgi:hypothetical protein
MDVLYAFPEDNGQASPKMVTRGLRHVCCPPIEYKTKNRTSLEARFLLTRNGHATFCEDVFYMKIKKIVTPLHAGSIIRGACFFEQSLELPCLSQIACTCDGTNCEHNTVKKQHHD